MPRHDVESVAPARTHFPALDGVRALAVLIVFVGHYDNLAGHIFGVEIFFVLSGFLITGILFDTQNMEHRVRNFYARRSLRIFPLYYAVWLALLLSTPWLRIQWHATQALWPVYLGNYIGLFRDLMHRGPSPGLVHVFYLRGGPKYLYTGHFWSLCVEEQFYLLWPFVVFTVRSRTRLMWICAAAFVVSPVLRWGLLATLPTVYHSELNNITLLSLDHFLLGGLGALLLRGPEAHWIRKAGPWLLAGGLLAFVLVCGGQVLVQPAARSWLYNVHWLLCYGFPMADLTSLGLILTCLDARSAVGRVFNLRPLRALGRISYGFYVFHDIPHELYAHFSFRLHLSRHPLDLLVPFAGTVVVATCSYVLLERPFLRLKRLFPD